MDSEHRSIAATTVRVQVPAELWREYRALHKDDSVPDKLGNSRSHKRLASALTATMAQEIVDTDGYEIAADGSAKPLEPPRDDAGQFLPGD